MRLIKVVYRQPALSWWRRLIGQEYRAGGSFELVFVNPDGSYSRSHSAVLRKPPTPELVANTVAIAYEKAVYVPPTFL